MKLIICEDRAEAAERLAGMLADAVKKEPRLKLGLSAGTTSLLAYAGLVRRWHEHGDFTFRYVTTFSTDEYTTLPPSDHRSTRYLMNTNLFCQVDLPREQTCIPRGDAADLDSECKAYDLLLDARDGLDVVVLGLGHNGHVGLNEPGSSAKSRTRLVDLTPSTVAAISGGERFKRVEEVPLKAITMGMADIIDAGRILLIACGVGKAEAVTRMCTARPGPANPSTLILHHPQLTVIVDRAAASGLDAEQIKKLH
ncbi:glucosamine-6-phosphate deaminase [Planctomycetota bacterium]|nr:glucosamine-6-phosphate deaminase [Planctomycetota bacterium]